MAVVLESIDYQGRRVRLTDDVWFDHVLLEHPELRNRQHAIDLTLASPHQVNQDKDHPDREVFYRRSVLPPPDKNDYLKVVVQFRESGSGETIGSVRTAFAITHIPREEPKLWTRT
ncbi:MAG TPA: hypothetical protein VKB09_00420 [Thermomicrobiales bacterium]|nr:hypothetical protein [Thermomicrobiales bacterium]